MRLKSVFHQRRFGWVCALQVWGSSVYAVTLNKPLRTLNPLADI